LHVSVFFVCAARGYTRIIRPAKAAAPPRSFREPTMLHIHLSNADIVLIIALALGISLVLALRLRTATWRAVLLEAVAANLAAIAAVVAIEALLA